MATAKGVFVISLPGSLIRKVTKHAEREVYPASAIYAEAMRRVVEGEVKGAKPDPVERISIRVDDSLISKFRSKTKRQKTTQASALGAALKEILNEKP